MPRAATPRLLLVSDYYHPHWTGISKSVHRLVRSFQGAFDITVLTVRHDPALAPQEQDGSTRITRARPLISLSRAQISPGLVTAALSAVRNADVVLINSPSAHILPIALLAKLMRKRLVIFHQGDLILPAGAVNRIIEKAFDVSSYISFRLADRVATYTTDYARHSRVLGPFLRKFQPMVMPLPGVTADEADGQATRRAVPADVDVLFGFAGRFVEEKGFDVLFDAIPEVIRQYPQAHFVFAGETNMAYEDFFARNQERFSRIRDHVTMLGLLHEAALADFYNALDFIVIPSRSDCFNLVQAEAMIRGKPSIVADIPGARAMVKETGFGLTFPPEDATGLARQLVAAARAKESFQSNYPNVVSFLSDATDPEHAARVVGG